MKLFIGNQNKLKNIWWVVIFFIILSLVVIPLIILADRYSFELTMEYQVLLILFVSLICQILRRKPISDLVGCINLTWLYEFLTGNIIGTALMILPVILLTIFGFIHWQVNVFSYSVIAKGICIFLLVAIAEELLFRGFMFQRLIDSFGKWPAQLMVAGLFLLTPLDNPNMTGTIKTLASINIFIASILFGIAYIKTKSLAMPIGLHFMANFMQGTVLGFGVSGEKEGSLLNPVFNNAPLWLSGGDFGIEASILGLGFVIIITISIYFWHPSTNKILN